MRIVDILEEQRILPELAATSRDDALKELVECIGASVTELDRTRAVAHLLQRERAGSTGIGQGIAIPHAKVPGLTSVVAGFGRSQVGIEFASLDGKPAHLFLALLAPEGKAGLHLKALARASRMLQDAEFRSKLMRMDEREALWTAIRTREESLDP